MKEAKISSTNRTVSCVINSMQFFDLVMRVLWYILTLVLASSASASAENKRCAINVDKSESLQTVDWDLESSLIPSLKIGFGRYSVYLISEDGESVYDFFYAFQEDSEKIENIEVFDDVVIVYGGFNDFLLRRSVDQHSCPKFVDLTQRTLNRIRCPWLSVFFGACPTSRIIHEDNAFYEVGFTQNLVPAWRRLEKREINMEDASRSVE